MVGRKKHVLAATLAPMLVFAVFTLFAVGSAFGEPDDAEAKTKITSGSDVKYIVLAAAGAVGISCLGAAYAVGKVGSAAMGAASERPELIGRALIFVGLAEGIAIYGLILGIMLLGRL